MRGIDAEEIAAIIEFRGQRARRFNGAAIRVIQRDDGAGSRAVFREIAHVVRRQRMLFKKRIAEDLLQIGREVGLAVVSKRSELDLEDLRSFHEQMRRDRSLVVFNEIEIARRNLELRGEVRLRHAIAAAKTADLVSNSENSHRTSRLPCKFTSIYNFTFTI